MCGCLLCAPYWEPALKPRPVLGIQLATLWFKVSTQVPWATPAWAIISEFGLWRQAAYISLRPWTGNVGGTGCILLTCKKGIIITPTCKNDSEGWLGWACGRPRHFRLLAWARAGTYCLSHRHQDRSLLVWLAVSVRWSDFSQILVCWVQVWIMWLK